MPDHPTDHLPVPFSPIRQFYGFNDELVEVTLHEPGANAPNVPEALIQDLWRTLRFDATQLATTDGAPVTILDPGTLNTDSGPDFTDARLYIDDIEWHGSVEIHTTSRGWFEHEHHHDPVYNGVVLHVALHADLWTGDLLREDGSTLPELVLYPHLETPLRQLLYQFYTQPDDELICASGWPEVPDKVRTSWIETLAAERIDAKREQLAATYLHAPDLEVLLHERIFAGLGYAKNTDPMTTLAHRVPLSLARQIADPLDLEALYLGVAGLLPLPAELPDNDRATVDYVMELRERFDRLQHQHALPVMERTAWRFFRLRPANFPPLRIAQGVALLCPGGLLHRDPINQLKEAVYDADPEESLQRLLRATPQPFWETHVHLRKASKPHTPTLGRSRCHALIINAVIPTLLLHADQTSDPELETTVTKVLHQLPPENDSVTRRFADLGTRLSDAFMTQGLHQLYRTRCSEARCLSCPIGQFLLDRG